MLYTFILGCILVIAATDLSDSKMLIKRDCVFMICFSCVLANTQKWCGMLHI